MEKQSDRNINDKLMEKNRYDSRALAILKKKEFSSIEDMKKLTFAKNITENEIRKENFVYSFLSSVRQKMQTQRKD